MEKLHEIRSSISVVVGGGTAVQLVLHYALPISGIYMYCPFFLMVQGSVPGLLIILVTITKQSKA